MKKDAVDLFLLFSVIIGYSGCSTEKSHKRTEFLMETVVNVTIPHKNSKEADRVMELIFREIKRVEKMASAFDEGSEVYRINKLADKQPVTVSKKLFFVIKKSLEYTKSTEGAFDISIAPIIWLWGFGGEGKNKIPSQDKLNRIIPLVDCRYIVLDENKSTISFRKKGMKIDLGGVVKGYAVDRAIEILLQEGIKDAMVEAGGDLRVIGHPPGRRKWHIGVQHPRHSDKILTVLKMSNKSVATSGDYENYFFEKEIRYHHLMNPKTGKPSRDCISVTILTGDTLKADILATAVFVLGPEKGIKLIEELPDTEGIIVAETEKGTKIIVSQNLLGKLNFSY
jgi:thiamine biosynthesis lipoprotein